MSEIERIFRRCDVPFGNTYNAVYGTAIVLWAFLSQVLADGKMRSCSAAVARIADFLIALDETPPSTDTGEYCKARKKLCEKALHDLVVETARKIEYVAPESWLWRGRHAKLVDGFTATMPDTPENQEAFPQPKSQEPGIGFPIMRVCVILSLATACVLPRDVWSLLRQGNGRNGVASQDARFAGPRRRARGGPLLLLLHDDRPVDAARRRRVRTHAPAAAR